MLVDWLRSFLNLPDFALLTSALTLFYCSMALAWLFCSILDFGIALNCALFEHVYGCFHLFVCIVEFSLYCHYVLCSCSLDGCCALLCFGLNLLLGHFVLLLCTLAPVLGHNWCCWTWWHAFYGLPCCCVIAVDMLLHFLESVAWVNCIHFMFSWALVICTCTWYCSFCPCTCSCNWTCCLRVAVFMLLLVWTFGFVDIVVYLSFSSCTLVGLDICIFVTVPVSYTCLLYTSPSPRD